jgi:hypothetical protein
MRSIGQGEERKGRRWASYRGPRARSDLGVRHLHSASALDMVMIEGPLGACRWASTLCARGQSNPITALSHVNYSDPIGSHAWYHHQKTNDIGSDHEPKSVIAHKGDIRENPNDREHRYKEREHSCPSQQGIRLTSLPRTMMRPLVKLTSSFS